jgi:hypothetical protein
VGGWEIRFRAAEAMPFLLPSWRGMVNIVRLQLKLIFKKSFLKKKAQ